MSNAFRRKNNNSSTFNTPFVPGTVFTITTSQLGQLDTTLQSVLINILELLVSYADGDFSTLAEDLTLERYNTLSNILYESRKNSNVDYEIIRNSAVNSLKGLQRAYLQYTQLTNTLELYKATKEKANILDDMTKLQEYIDSLNTKAPTSIFGDHHIQSSIAATVPPVYLTYINMYGFPYDGVFDPTKLAIASLNTT
jgi:hypothetical protein